MAKQTRTKRVVRRWRGRENRAKFLERITPIFAPSTVHEIMLAYYLAKQAHRWQVRKEKDPEGRPLRYFEHLRRVALIILDECRIADPSLVILGILHDGWEDTWELNLHMIEHCFGTDIAMMVARCSKKPKRGFLQRLRDYGTWPILVVKLADRLDNLRSLSSTSIAFQLKQLRETERKYFALADKLTRTIPHEHQHAAAFLRNEIYQEVKQRREALAA
ncbi:MAG: HD domain-containing protein [Candidatus Uhrbacteria bacterium]